MTLPIQGRYFRSDSKVQGGEWRRRDPYVSAQVMGSDEKRITERTVDQSINSPYASGCIALVTEHVRRAMMGWT